MLGNSVVLPLRMSTSHPRKNNSQKNKNPSTKTNDYRYEQVAGKSINLRETDPVNRLEELCLQGSYRHGFTWDKFANGLMITGTIYFVAKGMRQVIVNESHFILGNDLEEAKAIIADKMLTRIGLEYHSLIDSEEDDCDSLSDHSQDAEEFPLPRNTDMGVGDMLSFTRNLVGVATKLAEEVSSDKAMKIRQSWADLVEEEERKQRETEN